MVQVSRKQTNGHGQSTRVAVVTPVIREGDAVSNDAVGMQRALQRHGFDAQLFGSGRNGLVCEGLPLSQVAPFLRHRSDILILHYSIRWDKGIKLLENVRAKKVIKYHNITPARFFYGYSAAFSTSCHEGRKQLAKLVGEECDLYLADSSYNVNELIDLGAARDRCRTIAPFHQVDELTHFVPDPEVIRRYGDGRTNVLMVGRLAPNKGHRLLLEAFEAYASVYNPQSRLLIVGAIQKELTGYYKELCDMVRDFRLTGHVEFTGAVSQSELRAFYEVSSLFVTCSEHEGFCVPLIEAMALGVPIVALGTSAVPETLGEAGVLWEEHSPGLFAATIHRVVTDERLRAALIERGKHRHAQIFATDRIEQTLVKTIDQFLTPGGCSLARGARAQAPQGAG